MSDINVHFIDKTSGKKLTANCPYGTMADTLFPGFGVAEDTILALRVNNEICPVKTPQEVPVSQAHAKGEDDSSKGKNNKPYKIWKYKDITPEVIHYFCF